MARSICSIARNSRNGSARCIGSIDAATTENIEASASSPTVARVQRESPGQPDTPDSGGTVEKKIARWIAGRVGSEEVWARIKARELHTRRSRFRNGAAIPLPRVSLPLDKIPRDTRQ